MKLNILCHHKYFLLTCSVILVSSYSGFGKCTEREECSITGSNAASGIKSSTVRDDKAFLKKGWQATYPMFEGDYFSVTMPLPLSNHPLNSPSAVEKYRNAQAEEAVRQVVQKLGFSDSAGSDAISSEFIEIGPYIVQSGGGDILKVAQINCKTRPNDDPSGFCNKSSEEQTLLSGEQSQFFQRFTDMDAKTYLDRKLVRYYYFQRPQFREWLAGAAGAGESELHFPPPEMESCSSDSTEGSKKYPYNLDVFIEHAVITATFDQAYKNISVKGRLFPQYIITNNPVMCPERAVEAAYEHLYNIPGIEEYSPRPAIKHKLPLVLLPYRQTNRFELLRLLSLEWPRYQTPQLKYAYRTTLWGQYQNKSGNSLNTASWRAWIDAETGELLELVPQFEFAEGVPVKGKGWSPHPSHPLCPNQNEPSNCAEPSDYDDLPTEMKFNVDAAIAGSYCLKLKDVIDEIKHIDGITFCIRNDTGGNIDFSNGLDCVKPEDCLCHGVSDDKAINYLLMNAYAHVYAYQKKLNAAICSTYTSGGAPSSPCGSITDSEDASCPGWCKDKVFQTAKSEDSNGYVPLRVQIGGESMGVFEAESDLPHLTFGELDLIFDSDTLCASEDVDDRIDNGWVRPGAQDATLMTHEFAHVLMDGLLSSRLDNWCKHAACPVPLSSDIVHDMADGLSAVSNQTNTFGLWWSNDSPDKSDESAGPFREFDYNLNNSTSDHFPEHRAYIRRELTEAERTFFIKGYADGQIAAAALWAVTESVNNRYGEPGVAAFETTLLNVLPDHFIPTVCTTYWQLEGEYRHCDYAEDCDLDVFRYLHFLLADLMSNDISTDVTVASNKLAAGFARAGIFLVPPQCIDPEAYASKAADSYCPNGVYGGDAVIDIKNDWLKPGTDSTSPVFEVWTGPRYTFSGVAAEIQPADQRPCNRYYKITISDSPEFDDGNNLTHDSGWLDTLGECYGTWKPSDAGWWASFESSAKKMYYKVVTSDENTDDADELSSSEYPGNKPAKFGPPYSILK